MYNMENLTDLIQSFHPDAKKGKDKYEQFLLYVYMSFDKRIKTVKSDKLKNKYKEIRQRVLEYTVANKRKIIADLNKVS